MKKIIIKSEESQPSDEEAEERMKELTNILAQFEHILDSREPDEIAKSQNDLTAISDNLEEKL